MLICISNVRYRSLTKLKSTTHFVLSLHVCFRSINRSSNLPYQFQISELTPYPNLELITWFVLRSIQMIHSGGSFPSLVTVIVCLIFTKWPNCIFASITTCSGTFILPQSIRSTCQLRHWSTSTILLLRHLTRYPEMPPLLLPNWSYSPSTAQNQVYLSHQFNSCHYLL